MEVLSPEMRKTIRGSSVEKRSRARDTETKKSDTPLGVSFWWRLGTRTLGLMRVKHAPNQLS